MEYRWIENIEKFQKISGEWDKALLLSEEDNPFLLSDFILTCWKHYSLNSKFEIFVAYRGNEIIGGLPLYHKKNGYLEYPGGSTANYTEFLPPRDSGLSIWDIFFEALRERKDWQRLCLKRYRKNKLMIKELPDKILNNKNGVLFNLHNSGYTYLVDIPQDFPAYINDLPQKLRYYLRRSEKELSKKGKIDLCSLSNYDDLKEWTKKFIELSKTAFKKRHKVSIFEDKKYCLFFDELLARFYRIGYLNAHALKLDGRIIAIHFGYSLRNNVNYVFPTFDMEFGDFNPGHLLIYKLIELGSKRKSPLLDFYSGYSFYKKQWCSRKEEILFLEMRPDTFSNRVKSAMTNKIRSSIFFEKAKQAIRQFPALARLKDRLKV